MNRDHILLYLQEAQEQLARTIAEIRDDPEYDIGQYIVAVQHIYHHLNTAWNGRDASANQLAQLDDDLFRKWSAYPEDLDPLGAW
jgi:hypothetical protein